MTSAVMEGGRRASSVQRGWQQRKAPGGERNQLFRGPHQAEEVRKAVRIGRHGGCLQESTVISESQTLRT